MLMIISILTSLSLVFCFLKFMFSITMSLFFSHSCSSLSSSFIFFFHPGSLRGLLSCPAAGCLHCLVCPHFILWVSCFLLNRRVAGHRLVPATRRHLEAIFQTRRRIMPEALGPLAIQGCNSDFIAQNPGHCSPIIPLSP